MHSWRFFGKLELICRLEISVRHFDRPFLLVLIAGTNYSSGRLEVRKIVYPVQEGVIDYGLGTDSRAHEFMTPS